MSNKKTICIYTDPDFEIDGGNIFISMPYKDSYSFEKNNKDMKLLVSYSLDHLLDKWEILSDLVSVKKLQAENKKLREALEKYKSPESWIIPDIDPITGWGEMNGSKKFQRPKT